VEKIKEKYGFYRAAGVDLHAVVEKWCFYYWMVMK
jgi:hypothetical protein